MRYRNFIFLVFAMFFVTILAQKIRPEAAGNFSIGVRSSLGLVYENDWNKASFGNGGQLRVKLSDRVNTEWFADFLQGDLKDYAKRTDIHVGWSVLYYPLKNKSTVQPYLLAGHCFEFLKMEENANEANHIHRRSASVQAGAGTHWNLSPKFDVSLTAQYMMHFGTNINVDASSSPIVFTKESGLSLQDHLLFNLSLNYNIADLW